MLSVDQVFVMYDMSEQLLRYAMSNKIGDINGEDLLTFYTNIWVIVKAEFMCW